MPFSGMLEAFAARIVTAGEAAAARGLDLRTQVDDQRVALRDAAELGWTAV